MSAKTNRKQTDRKEYLEAYQEDYRQRHKRLELTLTHEEHQFFSEHAERHSERLGPFIKTCAQSHLNNTHLPYQIRLLELELRRIGTNVNQLTRRAHRFGLTKEDVAVLHTKLAELEDVLTEHLQNE